MEIEDLGRSDLIKVDGPACQHVALLTPAALPKLRLGPAAKVRETSQGATSTAGRGYEDRKSPRPINRPS
jgi:hypothetical protein